ncbi:molybdenum cofactor biosynthesis protein [Thermosulfidibacter takaii ABI70S6]|uniref:GTP 3',8-cyclase n=1 Tax=Thermosulfidibacter takaii (strain DSM 17441 / JCM 13301 / NBRC 103674 / ABI70S6) TaxID=1298851 RepID=A0A0S3QRH0_THET7|nr:GTP 3',8-cyclase MoaA [Thermosulfidibacter takaii]BAT70889.1 molybdenum cofactor biosynthesis protein [Thermosulfidibacter takaii ABI70S6]
MDIYLRLSLTDRCNMRCFYCAPKGYKKLLRRDLLSFENILFVLGILKSMGMRKLRITGGEPLLRKGFAAFIKKVSKLDIHEVCISTNGSLLKDYAGVLKESGVKRVNVSLDSLNEGKFMLITGRNLLRDVIEGIDAVLERGLEVKVNTVAMRGINDDEVFDLLGFAKERELTLRFIEFMPFPHAKHKFSQYFIPYRELLEIIRERYAVEYAGFKGVAEEFWVKELGIKVGFIAPVSKPFCGGCNRLRITADGKLRVCLHSPKEFDLKGILREGACRERIAAVVSKALEIKRSIKEPAWEARRDMVGIGG